MAIKGKSLSAFAEMHRKMYEGALEELAQSLYRSSGPPPTPEQLAQWEREAAERLARNREQWRQQECVFVVYKGSGCIGDYTEDQLSWWGSEAEAQNEVERLQADDRYDEYGWHAIPKGTLCQ
jgi:hypothetical protein